MAAAAEVIVICIDNSEWVYFRGRYFNAQREAIKFYCETIFKCNPKNLVGLFTMGSKKFGTLLSPTSDLKKILRRLKDVRYGGEVEFSSALGWSGSNFDGSPPNMKRRLLMFVGGPINLQTSVSKLYGTKLKDMGVALDVVNFFLMEIDASMARCSILNGKYHYARKELDALVTAVNDNDNSHIEDVVDESSVLDIDIEGGVDVSSVLDILSNSILKKKLHYLGKKAAEENVNFKQELEPSRNEKKKAAADEEYVEGPGIHFVKPKLERFHNEKNKSAADDEYVQAPGIESLSKKTPHLPRKKNKKKPKENVNV